MNFSDSKVSDDDGVDGKWRVETLSVQLKRICTLVESQHTNNGNGQKMSSLLVEFFKTILIPSIMRLEQSLASRNDHRILKQLEAITRIPAVYFVTGGGVVGAAVLIKWIYQVFSRLLIDLLTMGYPAIQTLRTLHRFNDNEAVQRADSLDDAPSVRRELNQWGSYWVWLTAIRLFDRSIGKTVLSWIPLYRMMKACCLLWLIHPATRGSERLLSLLLLRYHLSKWEQQQSRQSSFDSRETDDESLNRLLSCHTPQPSTQLDAQRLIDGTPWNSSVINNTITATNWSLSTQSPPGSPFFSRRSGAARALPNPFQGNQSGNQSFSSTPIARSLAASRRQSPVKQSAFRLDILSSPERMNELLGSLGSGMDGNNSPTKRNHASSLQDISSL